MTLIILSLIQTQETTIVLNVGHVIAIMAVLVALIGVLIKVNLDRRNTKINNEVNFAQLRDADKTLQKDINALKSDHNRDLTDVKMVINQERESRREQFVYQEQKFKELKEDIRIQTTEIQKMSETITAKVDTLYQFLIKNSK